MCEDIDELFDRIQKAVGNGYEVVNLGTEKSLGDDGLKQLKIWITAREPDEPLPNLSQEFTPEKSESITEDFNFIANVLTSDLKTTKCFLPKHFDSQQEAFAYAKDYIKAKGYRKLLGVLKNE